MRRTAGSTRRGRCRIASMISGSPTSVMLAAALSNAASKRARCSAACRAARSCCAEQLEERGRVLPLEALLHVLRGDDRVVVLGDDAARHRAHLAERAGAPRARARRAPARSRRNRAAVWFAVSSAFIRPACRRRPPASPPNGTICTVAFRTSRRKRSTIDPCISRSQRERADWPKMTWVIAFALRELDQRVGDARALQLARPSRRAAPRSGCCPPAPRDRAGLIRPGSSLRRLDVDGVPVRRQASGDARADAQQRPGAAARGHRHHHLLGNDRPLEPFAVAVACALPA